MSSHQHAKARPRPAVYKLLGQLARPGAHIVADGNGAPAGKGWRLFLPAPPQARSRSAQATANGQSLSRVACKLFDQLEREGLVELQGSRWIITREGAAALRRHLASGQSPDGFRAQHQQLRLAPHSDERDTRAGADGHVLVNDLESPLAWLRRRTDKAGRPLITDAQFAAGERLRTDFHRAHMSRRITASYDGVGGSGGSRRGVPGHGVDIAEHVLAARERINRALAAVGPELGGMLLDVCCHLRGLEGVETDAGLPQRSGKVVLLIALTMLARHYGLLSVADSMAPLRRRIQQWGAPDYRPSLEHKA